ncbi:hypothetical protein FA09DRAFT_332885 [Tilletiopsis washingtonensis]|uniref:Cytoplasmic tRNA 2-thiolation protein 2 n=1 Tax=Tilletiopsis washingtonensis TaxID=58919 RepID=A0A316YZ81_9BASI|nr:hypothetical protein FA09DRAFT_332885 [Tilletiopsis washingtonensis]PWN94589.1 hypothetical protein FA09DRAFT_332885 [Tilletiopsis washingtonensis]
MAAASSPPRCRCAARAQLKTRGAPQCAACAATQLEQRVRKAAQLALGAVLWRRFAARRSDDAGQSKQEEEQGGVVAVVSSGQEGRALLHLLASSFLPAPAIATSRAPQLKHITVLCLLDARAGEEEMQRQRECMQSALEQEADARLRLQWLVVGEPGSVRCEARGEHIYLSRPSSSASSLASSSSCRLQTAPSMTRHQSLHSTLAYASILRRAHQLHASVLLLPSCADCLAAHFLDALVEGNGFSAGMRGGDGWIDDLLILRPLRETSAKELAFYLHAKRLSYVTQREATMGTPSKAFKGTMRGMTEQLVRTLQLAAPSTPATVIRTASKLHFAGHAAPIPATAPLHGNAPHVVEAAPEGARLDEAAHHHHHAAQANCAAQHAVGKTQTQVDSLERLAEQATLKQGAAAQRFVLAALSLPVWNTSSRTEAAQCVLCLLPAPPASPTGVPRTPQRAPSTDAASNDALEQGKAMDISTMLCPACLRILETPQVQTRNEAVETLLLPEYVLRAAQARPARPREGGPDALEGFGGMRLEEEDGYERGRMGVMEREEMRAKVEEYLLE